MVGVVASRSLPVYTAQDLAYRTEHGAPCPIKQTKFKNTGYIKENIL